MLYRTIIYEALKRTMWLDNSSEGSPDYPVKVQSSIISQLIYDIFGGEILKTHKKGGWHFYNLMNGERIDFTISEMNEFSENNYFEDLPSNPNDTHKYFDQDDYLNFYIRFVSTFEEIVEQEKYQSVFSI